MFLKNHRVTVVVVALTALVGLSCIIILFTTTPSVSMVAPKNGATVSSSSVTLSATASDIVAVLGVQFQINSVNIDSEDTSPPYSITWNSADVADGAYTLAAVARNASGNRATSSMSVIVDNTGPVISAISLHTPMDTGATITWTTNEPSDSQVEYGTTGAYGSTTALNPTLVTNHSVNVTDMTGGSMYHYRIRTADGQGNLTISRDRVFMTLLPLNSRLVAEGDSLTAGIDSTIPTWIEFVSTDSNGRLYLPVGYNRAVSGKKAAQMAMPTETGNVVALLPNIVTYLAGVNDLTSTSDSPETIFGYMQTAFAAYFAGGAQRIVQMTIPKPTGPSTLEVSREADRLSLNKLIKAQTDPHIVVVDLETAYNTAIDSIDGMHPNSAGARNIGKAVATALSEIIVSNATFSLHTDPPTISTVNSSKR